MLRGSIGVGYLMYAKKMGEWVPAGAGLALLVVPYLISSVLVLVIVCVALMVVPFVFSRERSECRFPCGAIVKPIGFYARSPWALITPAKSHKAGSCKPAKLLQRLHAADLAPPAVQRVGRFIFGLRNPFLFPAFSVVREAAEKFPRDGLLVFLRVGAVRRLSERCGDLVQA